VAVYFLIIIILSFVGWAGMARIIRGMVLSVREREYVEAGRSLGLNDLQIITRHILPSTFTYAIIAATMSVPGYILAEAGLSFLGLGIRDPMASWGNMLSAAQNLTTLTTGLGYWRRVSRFFSPPRLQLPRRRSARRARPEISSIGLEINRQEARTPR
jgi:ABC-type dipeptide/oligopeptide/nickel transport system permease subunit